MSKFIFVTGGVVSGLGKGILAASLGRLLKERGLKVRNQKFDPYLNVDPGTMSPYQHGEVYVTVDGAETDLDLGHYERFTNATLRASSSVSAGKVYHAVIERERRGDYLGSTVQIIPHITDEIKRNIYAMEHDDPDVIISEIGGTVGDIESQPFLEAIRQVRAERGAENVLFLHLALVVEIPGSGEQKSKPVQHSVKQLLSLGIQPDIIVCRSSRPLEDSIRRKIALFGNVSEDCVIEDTDALSIYELPLRLRQERLDDTICEKLGLPLDPPDLSKWEAMMDTVTSLQGEVKIALVGKYTHLHDAYLSVSEALQHGGFANGCHVQIEWIESNELTPDNIDIRLKDVDGILVPGGFGDRGIEGMILAADYARKKHIPYFGICLGMQIMVIAFARNVLGYSDANSTEFDEDTTHPVIAFLPEQTKTLAKGGTMRLGEYPCVLQEGTLAKACYGQKEVGERHRHRYEFNNLYLEEMRAAGLVTSGLSPDGSLVEICELPSEPWYLGCQFHPEFTSRPNKPQPLFRGFIKAAKEKRG